MKFKKPSENSAKDTIASAGGVAVGAMLSKVAFGFVDTAPVDGADAAAIKKAENISLLKRGGFVVAGLAAAAAVDGNDSIATAVKGVFVGVAIIQGLEAVRVLSARSGVTSEAAATTTAKKALARAVGLGCPCDGTSPMLNGRGLRFSYPTYDASGMDYAPATGFGGTGLANHALLNAADTLMSA